MRLWSVTFNRHRQNTQIDYPFECFIYLITILILFNMSIRALKRYLIIIKKYFDEISRLSHLDDYFMILFKQDLIFSKRLSKFTILYTLIRRCAELLFIIRPSISVFTEKSQKSLFLMLSCSNEFLGLF